MNYKLLIALLVSAPLMAATFEEANKAISTAQTRVDGLHEEVARLRRELEECQRKAQEASSRGHEHREAIERHTATGEAKIKAHDEAIKRLRRGERELARAVRQYGAGAQHRTSEEGGRFMVTRVEDKELEPIRTGQPSGYESSRYTGRASYRTRARVARAA